jgi:hypothetical protein
MVVKVVLRITGSFVILILVISMQDVDGVAKEVMGEWWE